MAYGNLYPMNYQPQYFPLTPQQTPAPQTQNQPASSIIWVQGETGAKSFLMAPNSTVQLWDSEAQTIYLKSTDASGMPSMKILDYTIRDSAQTDAPVQQSFDSFVTKEELHSFEEKMQKRFDKLMQKRTREDEDE